MEDGAAPAAVQPAPPATAPRSQRSLALERLGLKQRVHLNAALHPNGAPCNEGEVDQTSGELRATLRFFACVPGEVCACFLCEALDTVADVDGKTRADAMKKKQLRVVRPSRLLASALFPA